jgi:hypothetical protein
VPNREVFGLPAQPQEEAILTVFAIDPGTSKSAYVVLEGDFHSPAVVKFGIVENKDMAHLIGVALDASHFDPRFTVVIEKVASMGMAVGQEIFETVYWTGRFAESADRDGLDVDRIERVKVKHQLCGTHRANDANIRQALIDRFGGSAAIKKGGPLYKISSHCWAALAVGITWIDTRQVRTPE